MIQNHLHDPVGGVLPGIYLNGIEHIIVGDKVYYQIGYGLLLDLHLHGSESNIAKLNQPDGIRNGKISVNISSSSAITVVKTKMYERKRGEVGAVQHAALEDTYLSRTNKTVQYEAKQKKNKIMPAILRSPVTHLKT
jgi:hypothetical protein